MKRIKTIIQSLTAVRREGLVFFVLALPAAALAQVGPGNALSFNGGDQSVVVPGFGTNGPTTEVTVEFWIKPSALTNQFIFSLSGSSMSANFLSLGQLNWSFGIGGPDHVSYVPAMSPGTWQHFALVGHSGGYLYIYRNGVLEAQKFTVLNPISQGNHDLLIAAGGGANFAGQIDELRIWNIERSQAQIQANMTRSLSLPQTNLVAYFRLDEGAGNFAYDASGEGQMGTLVNGPVWVASTIPFVPGVVTLPASEIGTSSASLNGLVNPNGAPALAWFEWGATTNYGNLTSSADAGSGTNAVLSSKSFSGLSANEIFNYRIVASNSFGLITGENQASVSDIGLPRLSIALAGSNALVSWPAAATSYSLETSTNLPSPTIWTEVSTLPQTAAGENIVTLPIDAMNRFLRLRQAPTTPASAFNNVPAYNLGMESAVNPAGGAAGDATYSQGISQVANAGAGGAEAMSASQGVLVSSGEFVECAVDLAVPSRGFSWKMERKYRSGATFDGPLGHNWDFSYNRRLFLTNNGDAIRMDGYGRADRYAYTTKGYLAPTGYYTQLTRNQDGTFLERDRHGAKVIYSGTNSQGLARMTELRDRNGNRMQFQYNNLGQLCRVLDTLGRAYTYRYDAVTARLIAVDDFAGRTIKYAYDINGDLVTVTSPGVTGTPNGNDFPNGKTWHYAYSSGFSDERLNHNLVAITAPNEVAAGGQPYLHADYQEDTSSPDVDRIKYLRTLGANTSGVLAGGTISYQYQVLGTSATNDFNTAVFQNTVTDRNGNQCQYQFNRLGNMVRTREFTRGLRAQEPPFYETLLTYNGDGQVLSRVLPLGNRHVYTYDSTNPDRFQQGNLLSVTAYPDQVRGGDQTFLKTGMTYEPVYNHVLTYTSDRGNDPSYVPQNGGPNSAARYTTTYTYDYQEGQDFASIASELGITQSEAQARLTAVPMGLGDINSDLQTNGIHGNRIRSTLPTAHLLPGSNQATAEGSTNQPIVTLYTYNQFGQMTSTRDPEGNVTQYSYNPENDPTGTGQSPTSGVGAGPFGYLHQRVADAVSAPGRDSGANPPPAAISRIYGYNLVGNVIRVIDGRGIATDYAVNQLNQVVQVTRAAAHGLSTNGVYEPLALTDFQYLTRIFYDANNNVVHRQVEDRGSTSTPDGFVDTFYQYDILNHPVQVTQEADTNTWLETNYRYDANGNPTWVVQPQGNAVGQSFDERNLPFETTIGATNPPPGTLGALPLGGAAFVGIPSIYTRNYDQNRNVIEFVDAADKDGSAANNSSIAGVGDATRYAYDGFDRRNAVTNAVGSQTLYTYDPAGRIVRRITRGPVGGPSPTDALGIDNVDLSVEDFKYDELRRLLQRDRLLFIPDGVATQRTISLTDGPLTPADGWISTRHEYDRNSRLTFSVDDNVNTAHNFYDGANRRIKTLDPESNTVEWAYDGNGNSIETRATDVCQVSGVTNEVFLITRFYDSLNHVQRRVDNVGQTSDYRYDSRANLVAASDANGPVSGSIVRRAFSKGALTVDAINGFGNVTLYSYDALNRKTRQDCVMTASGRGDGTHIGADMFGVKGAIPTPDTTQAGGDGLITTRFQYDANSRLTSLTDDNGNQTQRAYDNHNRKLTETKGICMPPNVADLCADPTTIFYQYDTDGNPAQFQDENGSIITNHFDAASRPIARDILRAPNVVGTTSLTYQYDGKSRLVFGADNNEPADLEDDSVITYAYDSLGRTVEESEQIGSTPAKAVSSFWEGSNHRTLLVYPNGRSVTNTFDHLNRLQTIADFGSNTPIATYSYLGKRRVAKRDYPSNNTRMTYLDNTDTTDLGYDGVRRPVQLRHISGTNILIGFRNMYDRKSNPLIEQKLHGTNDSELYHFDSRNRLTQFTRGTLDSSNTSIVIPSLHAPLQSTWSLDGVGNWARVDGETRQHNSFNEIVQRSNTVATAVLSDHNGNETDTGTFIYRFDYNNRLRSVTRKSDGLLLASYAYDARNRRIRKTLTNSGALNGNTSYYPN